MNTENFYTAPKDVDEKFISTYIDKGTVDDFSALCDSLKMTDEQALGVWYFIIKGAAELLAENQEDDAKICRDIPRLLQEKFGNDAERKKADLVGIINRFGGEGFIALMKETGIGYRREMLDFLMNLVAALGEDEGLRGDKSAVFANEQGLKAQIEALMKNPAYFKKTHPEHDACVQKVYSLRKRMFDED